MNDGVDLRELRTEIDQSFRWWLEYLGLRHWQWQIEYHFGEPHPNTPELGRYTCPMECVARWEYMQLHIDVYLQNVANVLTTPERRAREIERMVVHECCHALLCELRAEVAPLSQHRYDRHIEHEERVASMLTNALVWVKQNASAPVPDDSGDGYTRDIMDGLEP